MDSIITAIVLGLCLVLCEISIVLSVRSLKKSLDTKLQQWEDSIMGDLAKMCANEPSQSATVVTALGRHIGTSVKASLMADLSHASRQANSAVADAAVAELSEQQPLLGAVLGGMGKRQARKVLNSPLAQGALQSLLGGKGTESSVGAVVRTVHRD